MQHWEWLGLSHMTEHCPPTRPAFLKPATFTLPPLGHPRQALRLRSPPDSYGLKACSAPGALNAPFSFPKTLRARSSTRRQAQSAQKGTAGLLHGPHEPTWELPGPAAHTPKPRMAASSRWAQQGTSAQSCSSWHPPGRPRVQVQRQWDQPPWFPCRPGSLPSRLLARSTALAP